MEKIIRDDMPRGALLPELFRKLEYAEGQTEWEKITAEEFFSLCSPGELKHFQEVIDGKLRGTVHRHCLTGRFMSTKIK